VLYGMADKLAKTLADKGYRVRVYTPFGELIPGMSYLIRRLLENTANSSFLRQNLEDVPWRDLLAAPEFAPEDRAVAAGDPGRLECRRLRMRGYRLCDRRQTHAKPPPP
jgi:RHH-type proline utilization regulon transcriptional repressor/proline dehydrogenase/delta 1-pyrroline-5-carboxylate dehydrogenase